MCMLMTWSSSLLVAAEYPSNEQGNANKYSAEDLRLFKEWEESVNSEIDGHPWYAWLTVLSRLSSKIVKGKADTIFASWKKTIKHRKTYILGWEEVLPILIKKEIAKKEQCFEVWKETTKAENIDTCTAAWRYGLPALATHCPNIIKKNAGFIVQAWEQASPDEFEEEYSVVHVAVEEENVLAIVQQCRETTSKAVRKTPSETSLKEQVLARSIVQWEIKHILLVLLASALVSLSLFVVGYLFKVKTCREVVSKIQSIIYF